MHHIWDFIVRWRTWLVNVLAGLLLVLPDILTALLGFDWSLIVPKAYMPYVTLAIILVNILMRPRPAVRAADPEAEAARVRKQGVDFSGEHI